MMSRQNSHGIFEPFNRCGQSTIQGVQLGLHAVALFFYPPQLRHGHKTFPCPDQSIQNGPWRRHAFQGTKMPLHGTPMPNGKRLRGNVDGEKSARECGEKDQCGNSRWTQPSTGAVKKDSDGKTSTRTCSNLRKGACSTVKSVDGRDGRGIRGREADLVRRGWGGPP